MANHAENIRNLRWKRVTAFIAALAVSAAVPVSSVATAAPSTPPVIVSAPQKLQPLKASRTAWIPRFNIKGATSENVVIAVTLDKAPTGTTFSFATNESLTSKVTLGFGYSSFTRVNKIVFSGLIADVSRLLGTMILNAVDPGKVTMKVSASIDESSYVYDPLQSRYYKYIAKPGITWKDALAEAATLTFRGQPGHLATPSTQTENDFLSRNIEGAKNVWIAATDETTEGDFKWAAGDENGTTFWKARCADAAAGSTDSCTGANNTKTGSGFTAYKDEVSTSPLINTFSAWAELEPNNYIETRAPSVEEDYVATNWNGSFGEWNDLPNSTRNIGGYVVEFPNKPGKPFTDVSVATATFTVTDEKSVYAPTSVRVRETSPGTFTVTWKAPKAFSELLRKADARKNFERYIVSTDQEQDGGCLVTRTAARTCSFTGLVNGETPVFTVKADYKMPFAGRKISKSKKGQTTFGISRTGVASTYPDFVNFGIRRGQPVAAQKITVNGTAQPNTAWTLKDTNSGATILSGTSSAAGEMKSAQGRQLPTALANYVRTDARTFYSRLNVALNFVAPNGTATTLPYSLVIIYGSASFVRGDTTTGYRYYTKSTGFRDFSINPVSFALAN